MADRASVARNASRLPTRPPLRLANGLGKRSVRVYAQTVRHYQCNEQHVAKFFAQFHSSLVWLARLWPVRLVDSPRQFATFFEEAGKIRQRRPVASQRADRFIHLRLRRCKSERLPRLIHRRSHIVRRLVIHNQAPAMLSMNIILNERKARRSSRRPLAASPGRRSVP